MTYDILGRMITTQDLFIQPKNQPLDGNGTVYSTTTNTYNVRDQVTNVNVRDDASGISQNTQMVYDGHGRLKERWLPIYLGNPQSATPYDSYEYYGDDKLMQVTDPRGSSVTYGYNNRHLVTSITYSAPGGVAASPNVTFAYDEAGNRTWMDDGPGYVSYAYDMLSQLQSETRHFDELAGDYQISYTHNLAGQISTITDNRFNTTAAYTYNKAAELIGIAGNGYGGSAQNNFTASSSSISYRAWGGTKQLNYGNGLQLNLSYNERLQPTQYRLRNGQSVVSDGSDYQYYDDGRVKFASNMVATNELITPASAFDRAYNYDHVDRLVEASSGPEARGEVLPPSPPPPNNPYKQVSTYDVWGNLTSRNNRFWRMNPTDVAGYSNNRRQGWQYDQAGNALRDTNDHTYNAAGNQANMTSLQPVGGGQTGHPQMPTIEIAQSYDGDGLPVKRIETRRTEQLIGGGPQTDITTTVNIIHYVRPRGLGGQVMLELEATGNRLKSMVYAGNTLIAEATGAFIFWRHSNPVTGTMLKSVGGGSFIDRSEFDPFGAEVGSTDPYFGDEYADYIEIKGQEPLYMEGGDPFDLSGGCGLDGMPISCSQLLQKAEIGAVQAVGPKGIPGDVIHLGGGLIVGRYGTGSHLDDEGDPVTDYKYFYGSVGFASSPQAQQQQERRRGNAITPLPNLKTTLGNLLSTGDCGEWVKSLIGEAGASVSFPEASNLPLFSDDILGILDDIQSMGKITMGDFKIRNDDALPGDAKATGSRGARTAGITIVPFRSAMNRLSETRAEIQAYGYTISILHELIHHAAFGTFSDQALAQAAVAVGGLTTEERDAWNSIDRNDAIAASQFWNALLQRHCPMKQ
jgi:YD repeat-containing protein